MERIDLKLASFKVSDGLRELLATAFLGAPRVGVVSTFLQTRQNWYTPGQLETIEPPERLKEEFNELVEQSKDLHAFCLGWNSLI